MYDPIWEIRWACVRFIDAGTDSLEEKFTTEDDDLDSPNARLAMLQCVHAARELLNHLDDKFEFSNGQANEKEGTCPD